jgi:hypothetical protein
MSSLEFTLTILIIFVLFLSFALAVAAVLLANKQSRAEVRKIFQITAKTLSGILFKD